MTKPPARAFPANARKIMNRSRPSPLRGRKGDPSGISTKTRAILDRLAAQRSKK